MNDTPPPRRPRRSTTPAQANALPLIPILIGVVILGFIIGAGLSLAGKRGDSTVAIVAPSAAPTTEASLAPVTPAPTDPPTPTDAPATKPPAAAVVAKTTPTPSAAPRVAPVTSAVAVATATPAIASAAPSSIVNSPVPRALATHVPATVLPVAIAKIPATPKAVRATQRPAPVVAVAPVATAAPPTDAPAASDDADSEFSRLASAVVRQYVAAIERGDDASAYAAFGPNASGVKLIESGVIDSSSRIQHVEARAAGNNATVNVDLKTPAGLYFAQYTVHRTDTGAALIVDHALNKL